MILKGNQGSAVSNQATARCRIGDVRDLLGHADVSTTEVYARADERFKREALMLAYPSPSPEPEETAWNKNDDLMDWLKNLGK